MDAAEPGGREWPSGNSQVFGEGRRRRRRVKGQGGQDGVGSGEARDAGRLGVGGSRRAVAAWLESSEAEKGGA